MRTKLHLRKKLLLPLVLALTPVLAAAGGLTGPGGGGGGTVTAVTASAPLASSGGNTPAISWTGATLTGTPAAGDMSYWTGANAEGLVLNSSGSAGKVLTWASGAAPTWATPAGTPGGSNTQVQFNNSSAFGGSVNLTWVSPALSIGASGTTGQLKLLGATSGTVTVVPQATAGTPTITLPNATGTVAVTATAPIALDAATGALTWTGANIVTNGGTVVVGDLLYGSATASTYNSLAAANPAGAFLVSGGATTAPLWTNGAKIDPTAKHLITLVVAANTPVIGACGTSPSVTGTDEAMLITVGTGGTATSCAATFGTAFTTNPPICHAQNNTDKVAYSITTSTTAVTIAATSAFTASSKFHVLCKGYL